MTCDLRSCFVYLFVLIAICEGQKRAQNYQVPVPKVEALDPQGFRVILKDDGYSFFGFRGQINEQFQRMSEGDRKLKRDLAQANDGYWIYKNNDVQLEIGDTIYYWIYVLKNGKGFRRTDLEYTVNGFVKDDDIAVSGPTNQPKPPPGASTTESYDSIDQRFNPTPPSCMISKTVVQGQSYTCKDALIFSEEFDKTSLRELKQWTALFQFPQEPDYPFNVYNPDNTVSFEDGSLVITPVLTESLHREGFLHQSLDLDVRCTGKIDTSECKQEASGAQILPPVTTAKITTRRGFNFIFGRIEVRAKLPSGSWLLPEINLESSNNAYGPNNYESGLMRIAFVRGNSGLAKKLYGGPVLTDTEPFRSKLLQEKIGLDNWHKDFHNYTMVWRPDGIDLLVDGEQYGTVNPGGGFFEIAKQNKVVHASHWQSGTVMAPLDEMFHITIGLRVGGVNDFDDGLEEKPWINSASKAKLDFWRNKDSWFSSWYNGALRVDSVKVYAL